MLTIIVLLSWAQAETWQYARLTTNVVAGRSVQSWTSPTEKVFTEGGILVLAEKVMKRLISDTDDAFVTFLNFLGQQGWELAWVETNDKRTDYFFKRRAPEIVLETGDL